MKWLYEKLHWEQFILAVSIVLNCLTCDTRLLIRMQWNVDC